jgi:hypothetical protein
MIADADRLGEAAEAGGHGAGQGRDLARMGAAGATNPLPAVMSRMKRADIPVERQAPAVPQSGPVMTTA